MSATLHAGGVITVVQEQRFQLAGEDGTTKWFVLSHKAPLEGQDLQRLRRRGAPVEVRYHDVADLVAHVAEEVKERPQ